ncbi:MAG: shikimate dehydrogenase [Romboutsia sp.]|uniref:shikimate dehydrogenase n=1 Tax=Romboutsia sp. TaxID=1965302 RepID=UPI003F3B3277
MEINSMTKIIGLLGHPVKHSFSPQIHNYLFNKYKQNNVYCCFDIAENKLEESVESIKTLDMTGCNVTIPHKVNIIKHLDEIDNNADLIGAVNTIKNDNGILRGFNTDGLGFVKSILDKGYTLENKKIIILGAGGACRSIAIELASRGVLSIDIRNRSTDKASEIVNIINNNFASKALCSTKSIDDDDLYDADILINTTPIGMESDTCPIDESIVVNNRVLVCDIVYKPHNTHLIKWANKNNLDVVYGIDMLINQAIHAFYIWSGISANEDDKNHIRDLYIKK